MPALLQFDWPDRSANGQRLRVEGHPDPVRGGPGQAAGDVKRMREINGVSLRATYEHSTRWRDMF